MDPTPELQPRVTIQGDAGESGEFQDFALWINTGAHRAGVLEIVAPSISGCTLRRRVRRRGRRGLNPR